ncbi:DUF1810 domain-containing protein [Sphingomonas sp. DT-51]|uniref:DUF1810 domain-containing protein n=1 Tax=Sphingomonas sp. DT-51 TaxID=3396165 RepID=UPI003F193A54
MDHQDTAADLDRFVAAQAASYVNALAELRAGAKRSHWMWYIFPQLAGLGHSDMARRYAIRDLAEARAYLAHPLLGARYVECAAALLAHRGSDAAAIMGEVDAMKLRSSLTLFDRAGAPAPVRATLDAFFDSPDAATLRLL